MVISGLEALLGLMALSESLQEAVLIAIKNLAVHPKGARAMLEYDLGIVTRLTSCKVRKFFLSPGSPELFVSHSESRGRVNTLLKVNSKLKTSALHKFSEKASSSAKINQLKRFSFQY